MDRVLFILHRSPPCHGASKIGDYISSSEKIKKTFDCRFLTIKSSNSIESVGGFNFKKVLHFVFMMVKISSLLIIFKPNRIYFTASSRGFAFYRDLFFSVLWKLYSKIATVKVYYHYHTKGVNDFTKSSWVRLKLTRFFLAKVNLILLSPLLENDFINVSTYNKVYFLPNGVKNNLRKFEFNSILTKKSFSLSYVNILYLSNMIKSKGYYELLKVAHKIKSINITFNFAGEWDNETNRREFFKYIEDNNLTDRVFFHGFVDGVAKKKLFQDASLLVFPTKYVLEAFPLVILEALSYGVPVVSTNEGAIPDILDSKSGIIIDEMSQLHDSVLEAVATLTDNNSSIYCRNRYLNNFQLKDFENNIIKILSYKF